MRRRWSRRWVHWWRQTCPPVIVRRWPSWCPVHSGCAASSTPSTCRSRRGPCDLAAEGAAESPDDVVANRGRRSRRDAAKASARAAACAAVPGLHEALASGAVSAEHVDAVAGTAAKLDDDGKAKLAELADNVIASATALPVEAFERECNNLVRILSGDGGHSRHQRLRQARKVRRWVDRQTGMCKTLLELDPEADAKLWTAIGAAVRQARAEQQPGDDRSFDQVKPTPSSTSSPAAAESTGVFRKCRCSSISKRCDTATTPTPPAKRPMGTRRRRRRAPDGM
jgi:hypothetical protein